VAQVAYQAGRMESARVDTPMSIPLFEPSWSTHHLLRLCRPERRSVGATRGFGLRLLPAEKFINSIVAAWTVDETSSIASGASLLVMHRNTDALSYHPEGNHACHIRCARDRAADAARSRAAETAAAFTKGTGFILIKGGSRLFRCRCDCLQACSIVGSDLQY
jgi:hypothetical protein